MCDRHDDIVCATLEVNNPVQFPVTTTSMANSNFPVMIPTTLAGNANRQAFFGSFLTVSNISNNRLYCFSAVKHQRA